MTTSDETRRQVAAEYGITDWADRLRGDTPDDLRDDAVRICGLLRSIDRQADTDPSRTPARLLADLFRSDPDFTYAEPVRRLDDVENDK